MLLFADHSRHIISFKLSWIVYGTDYLCLSSLSVGTNWSTAFYALSIMAFFISYCLLSLCPLFHSIRL